MSEIITMPKFYSNREVAEILGLKPASIRVMKQRHAEELKGLWDNNNPDNETVWTEEGLNKLSEFAQTEEAKNFRAGALARRTAEAIAIDRSELDEPQSEAIAVNPNQYDLSTRTDSPRTGQQTTAYTINEGRYSQLPEKLGGAIAGKMVADGAIDRIDKAVVSGLLSELNIGDIDVEALLRN
ncbi:MAG: hypothetical protein IM535_15010 [Pseudanabaena sp. M38BS1SP1A06MG]|nr:hypothetical protein [Pseudanabaena sp. M53BS1SP1A06MG]MCA6593374.1 hypothetical protein [Pseudanabaena sp. M38BS1SP1A06MG]